MNITEVFALFDALFQDEDPRHKCYFRMKLTEILERRGFRLKMNPCGESPDDIVPDGIGGWKRRGDEAIAYTYGTGTKEATK